MGPGVFDRHSVTEEDVAAFMADRDPPPREIQIVRPSDILRRDRQRRFNCQCTECGRGMPNQIHSDICDRCTRQLQAELRAMGFGHMLEPLPEEPSA